MSINRILVIRGGAIGDFVLTLPAIKLLRDHFPQATLEILGYRHIAALTEKRFYAQAIRSIEHGSLARFFARNAELPSPWADFFHGFDLIVSYLFDPDRVFESNLRRCGAENFLACSPKITGKEHAARQLARPLEELDLSLTNPAAQLFPSPADSAFADAHLSPNECKIIATHPGSGSKSKNWPQEKWLQLLRGCDPKSLLIVGGESDAEQLATLREELPATVRFAEQLPLPQLAAVLKNCALFLGHDSGISHIAAAVSTPSVLLFGPSDPAIWAPAGDHVKILRAPNERMDDLSIDEVQAAANYELMRIGIKT